MKEKQNTNNPTPEHVAIIMDGNGRWAKSKGFPRIYGHQKGVKRIRDIVKASQELGIKILTLYAFSTENWKRPEGEVKALMMLLSIYLVKEIKDLHKNNVIFRVIGDTSKMSGKIQKQIEDAIILTKKNTGLILNIALNYGSRDEIIRAINLIIKEKKKVVSEIEFSNYLDTKDLTDPDLLIRTSGEKRISNFLLWQIAYSEIEIVNTLWPDFTKKHFVNVIEEFKSRKRRFGGVDD